MLHHMQPLNTFGLHCLFNANIIKPHTENIGQRRVLKLMRNEDE